jgi:hypothetical protein
MPDQSAEAILRYVVDSGISAIEFMGEPSRRLPARQRAARGVTAAARWPATTPEQQARSGKRRRNLTRVADVGVDGSFQGAAQDVQRRGVTIYAWKQLYTGHVRRGDGIRLQRRGSAGLHAHDARARRRVAQLKRIGAFAEKKKIYAAYHTHLQGSINRVRSGVRRLEGQHGERRSRAITSRRGAIRSRS